MKKLYTVKADYTVKYQSIPRWGVLLVAAESENEAIASFFNRVKKDDQAIEIISAGAFLTNMDYVKGLIKKCESSY